MVHRGGHDAPIPLRPPSPAAGDGREDRILLDRRTDRAAIDRAAQGHGWSLLNILGRSEARPRQLIFADGDGVLLSFVDDHRIDGRYVVLSGHDTAAAAGAVRASLEELSASSVLALCDDPETRIRGICYAGIVAPARAAEPWLSIIREAAEGGDEWLRSAARFAAEATGWPELRPLAGSGDG